jgi:hypothetical protein
MRFAETAWASYRLLFANWRAFLWPALAWSAAVAAAELLAAITAEAPAADADMFLVRLAPYVLYVFVAIAGSTCVSIVWHRFVILGEPPARLFPASVDVIGPYFARMVALMAPMIALYALTTWSTWSDTESVVADAVWYGGTTLLAAAAARLLLILPAAAAGDTATTIRTSWASTRGHGFQIFAGLILCDAPLTLAIFGLDFATRDLDYATPESIVATAAMCFIDLARNALWTVFISFAYVEFVRTVQRQADHFA